MPILFLCLIWINLAVSQLQDPLVHTYSIVARDPETGYLAVAVQSNWFAVGSLVTWAEAGVGAIATQSFVNVSFGPHGLDLLKQGLKADEVLKKLIEEDDGRDFRQLAIVDTFGNVAAYTGKKCIEYAGDKQGDGFSVQANLMEKSTVWTAMHKAYREFKGSFTEKLIAALEAAQNEGGDIRGKQSAAIYIVKNKKGKNIWEDKVLRLVVDDHPDPINELKRLYSLHLAYEHMNQGDLYVEKNDMDQAMREYSKAMSMFPKNLEMKYWTAVSLANKGKMEDALAIFKRVFSENDKWKILTPRLTKNGMLNISEKDLKRILDL